MNQTQQTRKIKSLIERHNFWSKKCHEDSSTNVRKVLQWQDRILRHNFNPNNRTAIEIQKHKHSKVLMYQVINKQDHSSARYTASYLNPRGKIIPPYFTDSLIYDMNHPNNSAQDTVKWDCMANNEWEPHIRVPTEDEVNNITYDEFKNRSVVQEFHAIMAYPYPYELLDENNRGGNSSGSAGGPSQGSSAGPSGGPTSGGGNPEPGTTQGSLKTSLTEKFTFYIFYTLEVAAEFLSTFMDAIL